MKTITSERTIVWLEKETQIYVHIYNWQSIFSHFTQRKITTGEFSYIMKSRINLIQHFLGCYRKIIELCLLGFKNLRRFPCFSKEYHKSLELSFCSSLQKFLEILGTVKPKLKIIRHKYFGIRELPLSVSIPRQLILERVQKRILQNLCIAKRFQ